MLKMLFCKLLILLLLFEVECFTKSTKPDFTAIVPEPVNIRPDEVICSKGFSWLGLKKNKTKNFGLELRLPFMDMTILNNRNVFVLKLEQEEMLFVLHGNELFQLLVSAGEKKLLFIGELNGAVKKHELLGADLTKWHSYLILTLAMPDHIDVYQLSLANIEKRAQLVNATANSREPHLQFELVQQLMMPGRYQHLKLIKFENNRILLVIAVNFTRLYGKLRTYEWQRTYFEPIEELTVPQMHSFHVINTPNDQFLITGRSIRLQEKSIITVYEFHRPTMSLRNLQTLTVGSRDVHALTFRDRHYLYACSAKQKKKCTSFRMNDRQFQLYKERSEKDYAFDKLIASKQYLVGARRDSIKMFSTARLDCHASFSSNETEVYAIIPHINDHGENFFLLHYRQPYRSLVRIVEVGVKDDELLGSTSDTDEMSLNTHQHMFESSIGQLRSLLLQRKSAMDVLRRISNVIQPKLKYLESKQPVTIKEGNIGIIKLVGRNLEAPLQLLERVHNLRKSRKGRSKRFVSGSQGHASQKGGSRMPMHLKLQRLSVENLIYDGDLLKGWHLDNSSQSLPTLTVQTPIKTLRIESDDPESSKNNSEPRFPLNTDLIIPKSLQVKQLQVQIINGLPWTEFYDSLLLRNGDKRIKGRLVLQAAAKVDRLETPTLNGFIVDHLFNLHDPQVIQSNIVFNGFFVRELQAERVNGLNFSEDIVFRGQNSVIETPVSMYQLSVAGDLVLGERLKQQRQSSQDELQQQYTQKVIINGSLTINNLIRDLADDTELLIADKPLSERVLMQNYLLRSVEQEFLLPVKFENAKVQAPSLQTTFFNHYPVSDHLLNRPNQTYDKPLYLVFMNASIAGNVLNTQNKSNLYELRQNVVCHGDIANITGNKVFESLVTVDNAFTLELNEISVKDFILKAELANGNTRFEGNKSFATIEVLQKMEVTEGLNAKLLNNLPLAELLNYDYHLQRMEVGYPLKVQNLVFHRINGMSFDDVWTKFKIKEDKLVLHKDLIVEGNVQFNENVMLQHINDINWDEYEASLVRVHEHANITGEKVFEKELTITKELQTAELNTIDFSAVLQQLLRISTPQVITGSYSFDNLQLSNLDVGIINDMPTSALIDTRAEHISIESDIEVSQLHVDQSLDGQFLREMPLQNVEQKILGLSQKNWRNIVVHGNASWESSSTAATTQHELLHYLYENAVRRDADQVISGNVQLQRPLISKMLTRSKFPKHIDIDFIAKDCLLKNTTAPQHITAPKRFLRHLQLHNVEARRSLHSKTLNNIDILHLNATLYRLTSKQPILTPLSFRSTPVIKNLQLTGTLNGVNTEHFYRIGKSELPPIKMHNLFIDNSLEIGDINDMSLKFLMENRIKKNSSSGLEVFGNLKFENLVLNNRMLLQSINQIPIDDLVFKHSKHLQAIEGAKRLLGNLTLGGPAHVLRMNGRDLLAQYQKTIFIDRAQQLKNLNVDQATFESGMQFENTDSQSQSQYENPHIREKLNALTNDLQNIDSDIDSSMRYNDPPILYMDYDFHKLFLWGKTQDIVTNSLTFIVERSKPCAQHVVTIDRSIKADQFYLHNHTTNLLTLNANDLFVQIENFCKPQFRKIKSKITLSSAELKKTVGMRKAIDKVEVHRYDEHTDFIILNALDKNPKRHEVRILKIDYLANQITDLQTLIGGVGKIMKLIEVDNRSLLVTSGLTARKSVANIYEFNKNAQKFELLQSIFGDYDFIEMLSISAGNYQMSLSCQHCQRVVVYEYQLPSINQSVFTFKQVLKLSGSIDYLRSFKLADERLYFMTTHHGRQQEFYLTIYAWHDREGWQENTNGYFDKVKLAVPLIGSDLLDSSENALLLICGMEQCGLVKALVAK